MQTDIEDEDLTESGRYQKRIEEQIRYVLWENDDIDLIIEIGFIATNLSFLFING